MEKNYGTIEKSYMVIWEKNTVLWTKLWYYTDNYRASIYADNIMVDYKKLQNFDLQ